MATKRQLIYAIKAEYQGKGDLQSLQKDLKSIGQIKSIKTLGAGVRDLTTRFNEAKKKLEEQARVMKSVDSVSAEMNSTYRKSQNEVRRLAKALSEKKQKFKEATAAAKESGVNTKALASEEKKLAAAAETTGKVLAARRTLDVRSNRDIRGEVALLNKAYTDLKKSGTASTTELLIAKQQLKQRTQELTSNTNLWARSIERVQVGVIALAGAGYTLVKAFQEFAGFETGMAEVYTLLDITHEKFEKFKDTSKEVMGDLPQQSSDLTKSLYDIISAGVPLEDANLALEQAARAASAGITETGTAVTVGVGAMNAYGKSVGDLESIYDVLFQTVKSGVTTFPELAEHIGEVLPIARSANVELVEVGAAIAALTKAGIKTPKAATAIKGAIRAMAAPAPEAKKAMEELGVSWEGLLPTLEAIAEKSLSIDQMRLLIPDVEASTGVLSLTQNLAEFKDILFSMDQAGGAMQKAYAKMADTPAHEVKMMTKSIHELGVGIGSLASFVIVPAVKIFGGLTSAINDSNIFIKSFVSGVGGAITIAALWKIGLGEIVTAIGGMAVKIHSLASAVGIYKGAVLLAKSATSKLMAVFAANPITATTTALILAAAGAWALFGSNSLEASQKHSEAARSIRDSREEIDKEIASLEKLQDTFANTSPASERFQAAERKLAQLLPGANQSLDEHGRVIARVGDAASGNAQKLQTYLNTLRSQSQVNLGLQIEQQARAYQKADSALEEYKENMASWYAIGGDGGFAAPIWRAVNKLTGTYDKNIAKGEQVRANLVEQKQAYNQLLSSLQKTGVSTADLSTALDSMHMSAELKESVLNDYKTLNSSINSVTTSAKNSATAQESAFRTAALSIKSEYAQMAVEVKNILAEIDQRQQSLEAELREMGRTGMSDYDAWKDLKKEADSYYEAAENAAIAGDFDEAVRLADEAKRKYRELNTVVKENDKVVISGEEALATAMAGVEKAGTLAMEALTQQKDSIVENAQELADKAGSFSTGWATAFDQFLSDGKSAVSELETELDRLIKERTITLNIQTTESKSTGGLVGLKMHSGGLVEQPQRLAAGGSVVPRNGLAGLYLSGYGGGDRRLILGEDGEVMLKKESVKLAGLRAALAFNAGRFDIVMRELLSRFDFGDIIRRQAGGIINSMPSSPAMPSYGRSAATTTAGATSITMNVTFQGGIGQSQSTLRQQSRALMGELKKLHRGSSR